ncbi:MAG: DUF4136 domain-containing protein, partial [Tannerellaceae bacterium]|nr:DUF4136 domain-containing protein [Tannerellaceae bacterium]
SVSSYAQNQQRKGQQFTICRTGFTYEISKSPNWGHGKPVITSIEPYSSAEQNGLQVDDIIEMIDSIPVTEIPTHEIAGRLNIQGKDETILIISNLSEKNKRIWIKKECKAGNAVTESQLAAAFYLYSPETTAERIFTCPFKTTTTLEPIDFSRFRSFSFGLVDDTLTETETVINEYIEQELLKKGLGLDFTDPDILIQTYYFFDKNPNFKGENLIEVSKTPVYRYDPSYKLMVRLPFLYHTSAEVEAEYLLQLGVRMIDQKITPGRVLWKCEANELLYENFTLANYARIHLPLMLKQYPYVTQTDRVRFKIDQKVYNYTGIQYSLEDVNTVIEVDKNSPAGLAGIRKGDKIETIKGKIVGNSWGELSDSYRNFVTITEELRDPDTRFRHPDYRTRTMYWKRDSYSQVAEIVANSTAPFSYLFSYTPYIDPSTSHSCLFVVKRGNNQIEYLLQPILRMEQTLSLYNR